MFDIDDRDLARLEQALKADAEALQNKEVERKAFLTHVTKLTPALRDECPVDTGNLQANIRCEWRDGSGWIVIDADYASFVINGTSTSRANDFPKRAQEKTVNDLIKRLATEIFKNTRSM